MYLVLYRKVRSLDMVTWFPSLYGDNGLFNVIPKETIQSPQALISIDYPTPGGYREKKKEFTHFETIEDLFVFLERISEKKQHFFEVIPGEVRQKPHFDIDKIESKDLTSNQLESIAYGVRNEIAHQLFYLGIHPSELRWYSSNSETKKSFHLIIPGYYFEDHEEAKRLWTYLQETLLEEYRDYVDDMVYSSLQNFRLLGSQKPGSNRPKRIVREWSYSGEIYEVPERDKLEELKESMITCIEGCVPFPQFDIVDKPKQRPIDIEDHDIPGEIIESCHEDIRELFGDSVSFSKIQGNLLIYERLASSYCKVCDRVHDSISPFVGIFYIKGSWKSYLYCFRSKGKKIKLSDYEDEDKEDEYHGSGFDPVDFSESAKGISSYSDVELKSKNDLSDVKSMKGTKEESPPQKKEEKVDSQKIIKKKEKIHIENIKFTGEGGNKTSKISYGGSNTFGSNEFSKPKSKNFF